MAAPHNFLNSIHPARAAQNPARTNLENVIEIFAGRFRPPKNWFERRTARQFLIQPAAAIRPANYYSDFLNKLTEPPPGAQFFQRGPPVVKCFLPANRHDWRDWRLQPSSWSNSGLRSCCHRPIESGR